MKMRSIVMKLICMNLIMAVNKIKFGGDVRAGEMRLLHDKVSKQVQSTPKIREFSHGQMTGACFSKENFEKTDTRYAKNR